MGVGREFTEFGGARVTRTNSQLPSYGNVSTVMVLLICRVIGRNFLTKSEESAELFDKSMHYQKSPTSDSPRPQRMLNFRHTLVIRPPPASAGNST